MSDFQCDCCGEMVPSGQIKTVIAYGIETAACIACRSKGPASTQTQYLGKMPTGYRTVIIGEDEDGDPVVHREPIWR